MISRTDSIVRVGVQPVVIKEGKILLGQRKNVFQSGSWGLPGGHLEPGESLVDAAARELCEETGIIAIQARLFCVTDPTPESNYHMQIGVEIMSYDGEPQIMEPEHCSGLGFFALDELPEPLFVSSVEVIQNYIEGIFYRGQYLPNLLHHQ